LMAKSEIRSRAQIRAQSVAVEAVSWMTPRNSSGKPIIWRSQSMTVSSSSVAAGDVCQFMALTPSPAEISSARMDGPELLAGK
jgi:hypothetical protein